MKRTVSETFNTYALERYPALKLNPAYRKLFSYLAFGIIDSFESKATLPLNYGLLANYNNCNPLNRHAFNAAAFLRAFRKDVLQDFSWNGVRCESPVGWDYQCRTVKNKGFDPTTLDMIASELLHLDRSERTINFAKQKYQYAPILAEDRKEVLADYLKDAQFFNLNEAQTKVYDTVQGASLSGRSFAHKLWDNLNETQVAIFGLEPEPTDVESIDEKQMRQFKVLHSIKDDSRVFYRPTAIGRTPRLHHSSACVLSLSKDVREAFCRGWTEIDLVSSQFKIAAEVLAAPIAQSIARESGADLWAYLHGSPNYSKADKAVYKEFIYSFCFGKSEANLVNLVINSGKDHLRQNPMLTELIEKRKLKFEQINREGSILDAWGKLHELRPAGEVKDIYGQTVYAKRRWAGSLLATLIQSIEMDITTGFCIDQYKDLHQIMVWIHDGVYVSFTSIRDKARIIAAIAASIKENGKKHNINAEIGTKDL